MKLPMKIAALLVSAALLMTPVPQTGAADCSAKAYAAVDALTLTVLCERNGKTRLPMASTTKVLTALVAIERGDPAMKITVSREHTLCEGSKLYLREGETLTLEDLLYGLLLASGNDCAAAVACAVAGSETEFVRLMNQRAAELGLADTHVENASGLPAEGHCSTACDMARLMALAMRSETFARISGTRETVRAGRTIVNHNKLLWQCEGVDGGKTGYTKAAGRCLVTTAVRGGRRIALATLNAPSDWSDHAELYSLLFAEYKPFRPSAPELLPAEAGAEPVGLIAEGAELFLTPDELAAAEIITYLPKFEYLPVAEGATMGRLTVLIKGEKLGSFELKTLKGT